MSKNVYNWAFPEQQLREQVAQRQADAARAMPRQEAQQDKIALAPRPAGRLAAWGSRVLAWLAR